MTAAVPTVFLTTIPFECPSCLRHLRMVADLAGRVVRCPVCRGTLHVPGTSTGVAALPDAPTIPPRSNATLS